MVRKLAAAAAASLILVAAAWAGPAYGAKRFASPTGIAVEPCDEGAPCTLTYAVENAKGGDEIEVLSGATPYSLTAGISNALPISIHGPASGPLPEIDDDETGSYVFFLGASTVSRLHFVANKPGNLLVQLTGKGVIQDTVLETRAQGTHLVELTGGGVVRDSVLFSTAASSQATGVEPAGAATAYARNDTISLFGEGSVALRAVGVCFPSFTELGKCEPGISHPETVEVANTILRATKADIETAGARAGFEGRVEVSHSNYRAGNSSEVSGGEIVDKGGNQTAVEPSLTSDFHEQPGSVTIDAGALVSELGAQDLDGTARVQGAAPDIGAYEVPVAVASKPPPPPPPGSGPAPVGTPSVIAPSASGLAVKQSLGCAGAAGLTCTITVTLTTTEHLLGKRVVGVSAAARKKTRKLIVGNLRVRLQAGQLKTVTVALNATGRRLAARFGKLPVTLLTTTTSSAGSQLRLLSRRLTLTAPRKKRR